MNIFPLTFLFLFDLSPPQAGRLFHGEILEQQVEKMSLSFAPQRTMLISLLINKVMFLTFIKWYRRQWNGIKHIYTWSKHRRFRSTFREASSFFPLNPKLNVLYPLPLLRGTKVTHNIDETCKRKYEQEQPSHLTHHLGKVPWVCEREKSHAERWVHCEWCRVKGPSSCFQDWAPVGRKTKPT